MPDVKKQIFHIRHYRYGLPHCAQTRRVYCSVHVTRHVSETFSLLLTSESPSEVPPTPRIGAPSPQHSAKAPAPPRASRRLSAPRAPRVTMLKRHSVSFSPFEARAACKEAINAQRSSEVDEESDGSEVEGECVRKSEERGESALTYHRTM